MLLGAFEKLQKATISFVMHACVPVGPSVRPSVCLSVCTEQLGSHWTDFHKILYLRIFRKSVEIIQFASKSDTNNGTVLYVKTSVR
jgi:hypothetical protein